MAPGVISRIPRALFLSVLLLVVAQGSVSAQTPQPIESGKFRLHKFEQPIGEETYTITRVGDSLVIDSNFEFIDRGRRVPLSATLKTRQDLTPESFNIKGSVSRFSTIDSSVEMNGNSATIREDKNTRQATTPERFFAISGYAPVTMQQMLVRYLTAHKLSEPLETLPGGTVTVERRGKEKITVGGKEVELARYSVSGLIWGREWLWFDGAQNLVAAVSIDAEFDHFEALRDGYESALGLFVTSAAADGMDALAQLAKKISPDQKGTLAITGATLIDGTGNPPVNDAVVVIEGDRIIAAGPRNKVKIPGNARRLNAQGKFLLPGLWEMHAHFEQVEWGPIYLAAGVTTVRDVGNEFEFITSVRDAIKEGRGLGPRMLLAGIVDGDSPSALGVIRANTDEEARAVVNRYHAAGFQQIKIYSSIKPDILKAICAEAHRLGMSVTGHIPNGMNAIQGVEAGMDQINHIQYIPPIMLPKNFRPQPSQPQPPIDFQSAEAQQALAFLKTHGTVIDPTMVVFEWSLHPADTPFVNFEPGAAKLPRELAGAINNSGVPAAVVPRTNSILQIFLSTIGALHRAGIPIVAGTDQVVPGHSLHRELELYVKAGFTPMEAIQAATIVPARVMKLDSEVGTIESGKRADLIILDRNPLEQISNIRSIKTVITGGRMYDSAPLWTSVGFKP
jgi:imidazolonepropionase-like amidohydrolase